MKACRNTSCIGFSPEPGPTVTRMVARIRLFIRLRLACLLCLAVPALAVEPLPTPVVVSPIVNGNDSPAGGQPWIVALVVNAPTSAAIERRQFCGGTLIAATWVVTAAHCVEGRAAGTFDVIVGREDLAATDGEVLAAAEIIVHPRYGEGRLGADIALLRLAQPSRAQPLHRATAAEESALFGFPVKVYGWGYHTYRDDYSCKLNFIDTASNPSDYWCEVDVYARGVDRANMEEGTLQLFSHAACDARYREYLVARGTPQPLPAAPYFSEEVAPEVLCAWDPLDAQAPCLGDSGGPLVGRVNGSDVLVGVVSFAYVPDCAAQGQLGIHARISRHAAFIDEVMARNPALGFAALCPGAPRLRVSYAPPAQGRVRVTLTWTEDTRATGWRLYYAAADQPGSAPATVDLPLSAREYAVDLKAGQHFHAALQARAAACDGPLSALQRVEVP